MCLSPRTSDKAGASHWSLIGRRRYPKVSLSYIARSAPIRSSASTSYQDVAIESKSYAIEVSGARSFEGHINSSSDPALDLFAPNLNHDFSCRTRQDNACVARSPYRDFSSLRAVREDAAKGLFRLEDNNQQVNPRPPHYPSQRQLL